LRSRTDSQTIFRGFLFYYGAALGSILAHDSAMREMALEGARRLAGSFNERAGLMPLGDAAEEAHTVGARETNIDGVSSSALLLWASQETGERRLRDIAIAHALSHSRLCIREDGSVCQSASFDPRSGELVRSYTHKGLSDSSTWARAQAWAMLGYSLAALHEPSCKPLVDTALSVAEWWMDHIPSSRIAYWDFDADPATDPFLDTSATAIAAAAMLKLSRLPLPGEDARLFLGFARESIDALLSHLKSGPRDAGGGMLANGCYNARPDLRPTRS
jgi:unsaturated chondroitin disaccharide hydrolase